MIEVVVLLIAPLLAGGLSLVIHRSALLHAINLTSMSLLVTAEIMITRTVLRDGPVHGSGTVGLSRCFVGLHSLHHRGGRTGLFVLHAFLYG